MKILFIGHSSETVGGAEDDLERLLVYFSSRKNDFTIDILVPDGPRVSEYVKHCSKLGLYKWGYLPISYEGLTNYVKFVVRSVFQIVQVNKFLKGSCYDLAVLNVSVIPQLLIPLKMKKIRKIVFIREMVQPEFIRKLLYRILRKYADYFVAISERIRENFQQHTNAKNIEVVSTCIEDSSAFSFEHFRLENDIEKLLYNDNIFKITSIGSIGKNKNQVEQLMAFYLLRQSLPKSNVVWLCIGTYDQTDRYCKNLRELINKYSLNGSFILFGSLNKSLVYKIIQKSNCIVITSLDEGFSIVMLEAFMFKKPLLATPVADIPKIVKDSENGMIIDYSAKNLADTIASLYHNRRFADTIAENGYKTFLTINNLQKNLHQTELIFRKNFSSD